MSLKDIDHLQLPAKEFDCSKITVEQLLGKIRAFYMRLDTAKDADDFTESNFLQLLEAYPVSMVDYNVSESLGLIIALIYFNSKIKDGVGDDWEGYTYDDLAVIFDRSKQTVYSAIKRNESKALEMLQETRLKAEARIKADKQEQEEQKLRRLNIHIVPTQSLPLPPPPPNLGET
ncbi:MAG: hypothetical protein ABSF44_09720 [Candidatus Bathyarchaeia archaeon]|jgi:hypothetical protein